MATLEDLVQIYVRSVPPDLTSSDVGMDVAYAVASIFARAAEEGARLTAGAILGSATGAFMDLHLKDRGLRRQGDETDAQAYERARLPPKAGTVAAILETVEAIVDSSETVFLIELPRQGAFFSSTTSPIDYPFFHDRGDRMGGGRGVVVVLIPASASAADSVRDAVRSKVSAGKLWLVEEYT